jgi:hypothetical protein
MRMAFPLGHRSAALVGPARADGVDLDQSGRVRTAAACGRHRSKEIAMSQGEIAYLSLTLGAALLFVGVLAWVSLSSRARH